MTYNDLLTLYFDRSNALQWYWTLYVVVIGGLLAFSSLRLRPDTRSLVLIVILYACFAYKNLGSIGDTIAQRGAILTTINALSPQDASSSILRQNLNPTLVHTDYAGARNFHVACDVLTILALFAMERRRVRWAKSGIPAANP